MVLLLVAFIKLPIPEPINHTGIRWREVENAPALSPHVKDKSILHHNYQMARVMPPAANTADLFAIQPLLHSFKLKLNEIHEIEKA